jgi:hypothetical protein
MRVQLQRQGGGIAVFPGLDEPIAVDTKDLKSAEASQIEKLVHDAGIFQGESPQAEPPKGAADFRTYSLTVEDSGRSKTVRFTDLSVNSHLQALVALLEDRQKKRRKT